MANKQPFSLAACMRFIALVTFASLSAVTVICIKATRKPNTQTLLQLTNLQQYTKPNEDKIS